MKLSAFRTGQAVYDRWFPQWGPGRVLSVMKTRVKIAFRYPPMYAVDGIMTFDREHVQFLSHKKEKAHNSR